MQAVYPEEIITEIKKLEAFYKAEPEHQEFYVNNPEEGYCQAVVNPKLEKFRKLFSSLRK